MPFRFEELIVYQRGLNFVDTVYGMTATFPPHEVYALSSQLRRAATSIVLNIAEGTGRTKKDFGHFLDMARTSAYECVACLTIVTRREYITEDQRKKTYDELVEIVKMVSGLKQSLL